MCARQPIHEAFVHTIRGQICDSLLASTTDPDGTITKVEFFQGPTLVGTSTVSPYSATLSNLTSGTYSLTAKATDNNNATTTSAPINLIINAAPSISLTAPPANSIFPAGSSINLIANANDSDGTVIKVEFYQRIKGVRVIYSVLTCRHAPSPSHPA